MVEEGSDFADEIWDAAERLVSSRLSYVETRAALASARRSRRVSSRLADIAQAQLDQRWRKLLVVELDGPLSHAAGDVADSFGLRAGDAIHLASALELGDPELVMASWDRALRQAALDAGLAVAP